MEKMTLREIADFAKKNVRHELPAEYSNENVNSQILRDQIVALNHGETTLNIKNFYRGSEMFALVEEILPVIIEEGLRGDEFLFNLVEYRNIKHGDELTFKTPVKQTLFVSKIGAMGTKAVRRQRLGKNETFTVETQSYVVKVYEELDRFLAKKVEFPVFIKAVSDAIIRQLRDDIWNIWNSVTKETRGLNEKYVLTGSYDETELVKLVARVEAKNGCKAIILGTKLGLSKLKSAVESDESKSDMYNTGYYGKFRGTDCHYVGQRLQEGTDEFYFSDDIVWVIPMCEAHPIKVVNEGEGFILPSDSTSTDDLTQNYMYNQKFGVAISFENVMGFASLA